MELTNPTGTPLPPWCSELIPDLHDAIWSGGGHHDHAAWCALEVLQRRGLLVQSEPEGEAGELVKDLRECADSCTLAEKHGWARVMRRAAEVLARFARPTIEPVPVSERPILKSSDFNDANGHCWCGTRASVDAIGDLPVEMPPSWELREPCAQDDCVLPHHALPVPAAERLPVPEGYSEGPLSEFSDGGMPLG